MSGFATAGVSFKTMTKEGFGLLAGSWEFYNCSQLLLVRTPSLSIISVFTGSQKIIRYLLLSITT